MQAPGQQPSSEIWSFMSQYIWYTIRVWLALHHLLMIQVESGAFIKLWPSGVQLWQGAVCSLAEQRGRAVFYNLSTLVVTQILGSSLQSLRKAAVPEPGWGHVFSMPLTFFLQLFITQGWSLREKRGECFLSLPRKTRWSLKEVRWAEVTHHSQTCHAGWTLCWPLGAVLQKWVRNQRAQWKKTNEGGKKSSSWQNKEGSYEQWLLMNNDPELMEKGNSKSCAQNTNILEWE